MKRYRVVNKKRFYLFISIVSVLIFTSISLLINSKGAHSEVLNQEYKEVQVLSGDTLWKIAKKYMPDDYDTRYLVYKLKDFNDLDTACIYAGETIKVPIID